MKVLQYVYWGEEESSGDRTTPYPNSERTNTLAPGQVITFDNQQAYRIAFQALPGTLFTLKAGAQPTQYNYINPNDKSVICMGPTGIYELGYTEALIPQFLVLRTVDNESPMILDALVYEASDTYNTSYITNYLNSLLSEENYEGVDI